MSCALGDTKVELRPAELQHKDMAKDNKDDDNDDNDEVFQLTAIQLHMLAKFLVGRFAAYGTTIN